MIARYEVAGHSMEPKFLAGERILVKTFLYNLKVGDVVVFNDGKQDYLKRIVGATRKHFVLKGDNKGHSSKHIATKKQIKGKFLMKYR